MDAKYVNITPDTLNFLTENITVDELYGSMINYLNEQIDIKYRAFDISYDLGDLNSLVEDRVYYDYSIHVGHINTRFNNSSSKEDIILMIKEIINHLL